MLATPDVSIGLPFPIRRPRRLDGECPREIRGRLSESSTPGLVEAEIHVDLAVRTVKARDSILVLPDPLDRLPVDLHFEVLADQPEASESLQGRWCIIQGSPGNKRGTHGFEVVRIDRVDRNVSWCVAQM